MPKIIQTTCDVIPDEGLLVRSAYLRNDIKASALIAEARRRAAELLARSEENAERAYLEAKTEGYAAGILHAAEALTQYLSAHAEFSRQLQAQLQKEVGCILRHCVSDTEVVMAAFEECLKERDSSTVAGVDFLLPEHLRRSHRSLVQRLQQQVAGPVRIEYHQDTRFLLRFGDQIAEFSPDEFIVRASDRVMFSLPSIYEKNQALAERCRQQLASLFEPAKPDVDLADPEQISSFESRGND